MEQTNKGRMLIIICIDWCYFPLPPYIFRTRITHATISLLVTVHVNTTKQKSPSTNHWRGLDREEYSTGTAASPELWAPAGPVWRQMWRSWVLDTASHSSAPPDEKYLQIEKSVSFNLVLMFLICGQCLKCQELDPEAVRGPGMWSRLIWASIKSIKRIW